MLVCYSDVSDIKMSGIRIPTVCFSMGQLTSPLSPALRCVKITSDISNHTRKYYLPSSSGKHFAMIPYFGLFLGNQLVVIVPVCVGFYDYFQILGKTSYKYGHAMRISLLSVKNPSWSIASKLEYRSGSLPLRRKFGGPCLMNIGEDSALLF